CEFVISLYLLGHRADVAKFHAELVVGRAGLRVVGTPSVVAEGLEPCEDVIDGHADDYTRDSKQGNHDRRSLQVGCVCCRGTAAMKSSSSPQPASSPYLNRSGSPRAFWSWRVPGNQ